MNTLELIQGLGADGGWAVVSAERPGFGPDGNLVRGDGLALQALAAGLAVIEVYGCYKGGRERSFILVGDGAEKIGEWLGRDYQQESILTAAGLLYLADGRIEPVADGARWKEVSGKNRDFFSELADGTRLVYE